MLVFDGVWKSYSAAPALRGISIAVSQGDALLVTGPSGAGKSTLLRLLYCAERPDRGEVYVAGRSLARLDRSSVPYVRRNLGIVFQDFALLPERTALDNVAVALEILGLPRTEIEDRAIAMLGDVGLSDRLHVRARALSGGEQQRVALARALVNEPSVVLADEPTGSLDPGRAEEVLGLLERAHLRGATVVIATHDPNVVAYGAKHGWRRAHLRDGELVDLDMPQARPARLDDETGAFATTARGDETVIGKLRGAA
jgi:cell division transport system ATP-binding protein